MVDYSRKIENGIEKKGLTHCLAASRRPAKTAELPPSGPEQSQALGVMAAFGEEAGNRR